MSKIICDICGTEYPETSENCPICGYSQSMDLKELLTEEALQEDYEIITHNKGGKFTESAVNQRYNELFDFDAEEEAPEEEDQDEIGEDEESYEQEPKSNTFLVILLVIIITLLLVASGFLFVRYFLPNMTAETEPTVAETILPTQTEPQVTTEPAVPCESLVITSDKAVLNMEGKNWLLHVTVKPEDTTDTLTFVSEDESVATVNSDGRITAVGEGSTNILVICGDQQIKYPVEVQYVEETAPDTDVPAPTVGETTGTEETVATEATQAPEETSAATEPSTEPAVTEPAATEAAPGLKDVVLKLGRSDISLTVGYSFELPLECDLTYEEIEWSVEHSFIATVKNGVVTAISKGTTEVTAKYGDQEVTCLIRCNPR